MAKYYPSFDALSIDDAKELSKPFTAPLTARITNYLRGQQLGSSSGGIDYWTGPMVPSDHPEYANMLAQLQKSFVSDNKTLEVCERLAEGVLGDEPAWNYTPRTPPPEGQEVDAGLQALITEAELAVTGWYDRLSIPSRLLDFATVLVAHGRAPLRFFVDPTRVEVSETGEYSLPPTPTLDDALRLLRVQFPSPTKDTGLSITSVGVYEDPMYLTQAGVFYYKIEDKENLEVSYVTPEDNLTVLKILTKQGQSESSLDLWGLLWVQETKLSRGLVTIDLLQNQDALNVANTMLPRNTHFAGYVERFGIGIEPPGSWEPDPANPGEQRFVPAKFQTGPMSLNFFQPSAFEETSTDSNGNQTKSLRPVPAQYGRMEPSKPEAITAAILQAELNIYSIARQRFVLMGDDATASGRSREVATGDHLRRANGVARAIEGALRGILEFALAFSAACTNRSEAFKQLRATVQCRVTAFTPTPQEREQNRLDVAAGLMSQETARSKLVADVDAEGAKILAELNVTPRLALEVLKQGGPTSVVLQGLLDAGVTAVTPEMVTQQRELDFAQVGQGIENPDAGMDGEGVV